MKNKKVLKNMDVDLDTLQFFSTEEFNKFMSDLLNQDTLNSKSREEVFDKIQCNAVQIIEVRAQVFR